jgi:hypothetical protein
MKRLLLFSTLLISLLVGTPAVSAEFKPYPYQFEGAWGINGCQDFVMEFRRGEFMQCGTGNDQCVENPAKYKVEDGKIDVVRDASIDGVRYDIHLLYKMDKGCVVMLQKQIRTDHETTPVYTFDDNTYNCKCKRGLLWGWNTYSTPGP